MSGSCKKKEEKIHERCPETQNSGFQENEETQI